MRTLIAVISMSALVSCGSKATPSGLEQAKPTTVSQGVFSNVPADTPYFMGNWGAGGRTFLDQFVNTTLVNFGPVVEQLNVHLDESKDELNDLSASEKLMFAVFRELRGRMSAPGLLELGIDLSRPYVVFGLGYYPALRLELADASKFKAAIERILASAGVTTGKKTIAGLEYWQFDLEEDELKFSLVFALDENQISAAAVSTKFADLAAAFVTGKQRPIETLADSKLAKRVADSYKLKVDGIGLIDTARILAIATGQTADVGETTAKFMDGAPAKNDACLSQLRSLATMFPRVVWGNSVLTAKRHVGGFFLETSASVAEALTDLQTPMPDLSGSKSPMVMGFGVDGKAAYKATVAALDQLAGLNECADDRGKARAELAEIKADLAGVQPVFSMIGGMSIAVDDLQINDDGGSIRAIGAAFVNDSAVMHSMLSLVFPISLPPPGDSSYPLELPLPSGAIEFGKAFFDLSEAAVGFSVGHDSPAALKQLIARRSSGGELMVFEATGDLLDKVDALDNDDDEGDDDDDDDDEDISPELQQQLAGLERSEYERIRVTAVVQKRGLAFLFDGTFR